MSKGFVNPKSGLRPQEERFAAYLACGKSQIDAYRLAFKPGKKMKQESMANNASRLANRHEVMLRVQEICDKALLDDIESVGEAYRQMLVDQEAARLDKNHNAVAQYTRIKFQAKQMMSDKLVLAHETRSDADLIDQVVPDRDKAKQIKDLLAVPDDFPVDAKVVPLKRT